MSTISVWLISLCVILCQGNVYTTRDTFVVGLTLPTGNLTHYPTVDINQTNFNQLFWNSADPIIRRECLTCEAWFQTIFYKRITNLTSFDAYSYMKSWRSKNNMLGIDFNLYSTLANALNDENPWGDNCDIVFESPPPTTGAFGRCDPDHWQTSDKKQWSAEQSGVESRFSIYTSQKSTQDLLCEPGAWTVLFQMQSPPKFQHIDNDTCSVFMNQESFIWLGTPEGTSYNPLYSHDNFILTVDFQYDNMISVESFSSIPLSVYFRTEIELAIGSGPVYVSDPDPKTLSFSIASILLEETWKAMKSGSQPIGTNYTGNELTEGVAIIVFNDDLLMIKEKWIMDSSRTFNNGTTYQLKIHAEGSMFNFYVDDSLIFTQNMEFKDHTVGSFGLSSSAPVTFSRFKIQDLTYYDYPNYIISVTACSEWDYGSTSNTLQIQLKGSNGSTPLVYVNDVSVLPINGKTSVYYVQMKYDIGKLYSVWLSVQDSYGYCIQNLHVNIGTKHYTFNHTYFGNGVILSSTCEYTFRSLASGIHLLPCFDVPFELGTFSSRGIYNLTLHTCANQGSGMSETDMVGNLYTVIMGKKGRETSYSTTETIYLDHYAAGQFNIAQLGHLIAGNLLIFDEPTDVLYSSVEGTVFGVKLEIVASNDAIFYDLRTSLVVNVAVDGNKLNISSHKTFENGKYLVVFFEQSSRVHITKTSTIQVYNIGNTAIFVNIYIIFDGYNDHYMLPWKIEYNATGINWADANDKCKMMYGTTLASIHSVHEEFLLYGFLANSETWIGLFNLQREKQNNWKWVDKTTMDYINLDIVGSGDCAYALDKGGFRDAECSVTKNLYACASPKWTADANRVFQINSPRKIVEPTLVSIGMSNTDIDNICIDSVAINDQLSIYMSNNWFGKSTLYTELYAVFKYPVCKTEVIGLRIDFDKSKANLLAGDNSIVGLQCSNPNRLIESTCTISQTFESTKTTSFSISKEDSKTHSYSWGSSSSVNIGHSNSNSKTSSNDFSWGLNEQLTIGFEQDVNILIANSKTSQQISVGSKQDWSQTTSNTDTDSDSTSSSNSHNNQNSDSSTGTAGSASSYGTSESVSVTCSGSISVPPSHSIQYSLIFNSVNTTVNTYTDLKLTLCKAFLDPFATQDETDFIYLDNIPGTIKSKERKTCDVNFDPAVYIRNDISCAEEQQVAISTGSYYIPTCQADNSTSYDGCQCKRGEHLNLVVCWCSDDKGNKISDKTMQVPVSMSYQQICVEKLQCSGTSLIYDTSCIAAQQRAIDAQSSYIPQCNDDNPENFDGCQCDHTISMCWCVDTSGNKLNLNARRYDDTTYQQVCSTVLNCNNTMHITSVEFVKDTSELNNGNQTDGNVIINSKPYINNDNGTNLAVAIAFLILFGIFIILYGCNAFAQYAKRKHVASGTQKQIELQSVQTTA
eukprot:25318_1